ncbi:MAG: hypothetical protein Q6373_024905 [Candidatus Sigynarchaeota archaeon]
MAPNTTQGNNLEKITNRAWRTWWFLFYLLIIPATTAFVSFFMSNYLSGNTYFSINFTTILTLASIFAVYKRFDKYLEKPILKNDASNASFRVHAPFFFSMVALVSAFVILVFTVEQQLFKPLPIIALGVVYSFTWLYYRWKPIDHVDPVNKAFKHAPTFAGAAKNFHNVVVFFHLAFQFAMISFYMSNPLLWGGIGIPINIAFWIAGIKVTAGTRKLLQGGLLAGNDVTVHFAMFKKQFAQVMIAACASFILIIIFYPLIVAPGLLDYFPWFMLFIYGLVIAGVLLVKAEAYVAIYFNKQINVLSGSEHVIDGVMTRLNKASIGATAVLIATSFIMGFVPGIPLATPITVAAVYAMVLGERKAKLVESWWYSLSHLANTICLIASISFGVLPSLSLFKIPVIIQAAVFVVSLYTSIECYCGVKYFKKHRISELQDAMAVCSFAVVAYSFYEILLDSYLQIAGITSIGGIFTAGTFMGFFISGIVLLLTLYRFYWTRGHGRTSRGLKIAFSFAFAWIGTALTALFMLDGPHLVIHDPVNLTCWTVMWWAGTFILFVAGNNSFGIYFQRDVADTAYRASIAFIIAIPTLIIYNLPTFSPILAATIALTFTMGYYIKWGARLGKVTVSAHENYLRCARPVLVCQMLAMQLGWYIQAGLDPILASYIAVMATASICTLFMQTDFFKWKVSKWLDIVALYFTSVMIFKGLHIAAWRTPYVYLVPLLVSALFTFLPLYFTFASLKSKAMFSRAAFANSLLITVLLLALPTAIMVDLESRFHLSFNVFADLFYTLLLALTVFFAFSGALTGLRVKPSYIKPFKWGTVVSMAGISVFGAATLYSIIARAVNAATLPATISLSFTLFFAMNFITVAILHGYQLTSKQVMTTATRIVYFSFVISLSLLFTQLLQRVYPISAFPVNLNFLGISWYVLFFALFALTLSSIPRFAVPDIKPHVIERVFATSCWILLDGFGCLYIAGFLATGTLLGFGTLLVMLIACTAPATRFFLRDAGMRSNPKERAMGTAAKYAFLASSLAFLLERARIGGLLPATTTNLLLYILLLSNIASYGLLFAAMINQRGTRFSSLIGGALVLVLALAFLPSWGNIICAIVAFGSTAKVGGTNEKIRWIRTAMLSTVLFSVIIWFQVATMSGITPSFMAQGHIIEFTACIFTAVVYGIATTVGKKSLVEGNVASMLGGLLVFQLLLTFTPTSIFHSANIMVIVYLSLMAIYFNKAGSVKKYAMLKALTIVSVIYLVTGTCSLVFNRPALDGVNFTLSFLATYNALAFIIIRFFKPFMLKHRKSTLAPMLAAFNVFIPAFVFLLFTYYAVIPIDQPILVLLCVDLSFFLCFLSIGVFRWNLTKEVWKVGWWLWLVFPIINFQLVFEAVQGVDVVKGLNLFSIADMPGSIIITLIIISAMYLPVVRYKIQRYFYPAMLVIWAESLLMIDWVVQNVFASSLALSTLSFLVIGTGLLLPLFYKWRAWRAMAIAWAFLTGSNVMFMHLVLMDTGISTGFIFSIELIVTSILGMLYSAIPKSPARRPLLVASYTSLLAGMWSTVYFTIYEVTRHAFISVNIAFIALAFGLFSSRFLKVNQVTTRALIAFILMANLSLLTFNTLALVHGFVVLATFAGITVFGGSFYTMNQYKMVFHVDKRIPWSILGIGSALSASSLVVSAWQAPPMIVGFVFSLTAGFFFYKDFLVQVKAAFIPLPLTFLAEQLFVALLPGQNLIAILLFSTCYLAIFQVVANAGAKLDPAKLQGVDMSRLTTLLPRLNLVIFLANSMQISAVISMLLAAPVVLTLVLPFFLICCQSFAIRKGIAGKSTRVAAFMTAASTLLHASIAASIMFLFPIPAISTLLPPDIATILAKTTVFMTSMFVQLAWLDMGMFKIMVARTRFALMLLSYAMAFNFIAIYLYINHADPSLLALSLCALNVLTMHLWQLAFPARKIAARNLKRVLYNGILASGASFASRWVAFEPSLAVDPTGLASWLLYLTFTFLFLILLNLLLNKTLPGRAYLIYQFSLYMAFQLFLSLSWTRLLPSYGPVGLISITGLALIETFLAFVPFHFVLHGMMKRVASRRSFSALALLVYLEVSFLVYAGPALALGTVESVLLGLGCMFVISLVDFHGIKCIKPSVTWGLNLASYVPFMLTLLLTWTENLPVIGPVGLVSILGLALVETALAFYVIHVIRHRLAKRPFSRRPFAWLMIPIYAELSFLAFAVTALVRGSTESALNGFIALFFLTILEIYVVKCVSSKIGYVLNMVAYIPFMATLAIEMLGTFPAAISGIGLVSIAVFLLVETLLGLYLLHVVRHRLLAKPFDKSAFTILTLPIYFEISFIAYASATLALDTNGSILTALGVLFTLTLLDVHGIRCLKPGIGYVLNLASYLPLMITFAIGWVENLPVGIEGIALLSSGILALLETLLAIYPFHIIHDILLKRKIKWRAFGPLFALLYIEIAIIAYAGMSLVLGMTGGIFSAFACLFVLAIIESYGVKCMKPEFARLLVVLGWLPLTVISYMLVSAVAASSRGPFMSTIAAFLVLQQYTNRAIITMLIAFSPSRDKALGKAREIARRLIGLGIYAFVFLALQAFVSEAGFGTITQSLAISFAAFILSLLDRAGLNCFGKWLATAMTEICWILFSVALTSGVIWLFGSTPALMPIIAISIDLEAAAAVGFLKDFKTKKYGARSRLAYRILIVYLYIIISTWPNFLWANQPLIDTWLVFGSILLFDLFLRGDVKGARAMPGKVARALIRADDITICCWLGVLAYQGLQSIPGSIPFVSFMLSSVIGITFLYIPLQPFKRGGFFKQVYWTAFSIACATLTTTTSFYYAPVPRYVHFLFGGLVFFLLFRVVLERKDRSPTGRFLINLIYYIVIYSFVAGILLGFTNVTLIMALLVIIIFGAILSGMVYFYEKRGTISMKWRLFTSITLICLIGVFMLFLVLWASGVPLPRGIITWAG